MKVCLDATALMCLLDTRTNEFPALGGSVVGHMQPDSASRQSNVNLKRYGAVGSPCTIAKGIIY